MCEKIIIRESKTADTRTCDVEKVTKEQLLLSSIQHINDVQQGMNFLSNKLVDMGRMHDKTKISDIDGFYKDFKNKFETIEWWNNHKKKENHHLSSLDGIRENVNLLDVLEYIVDGVMAGLGRSGEYRRENIPDFLLKKAFENTINLLLENTEVKK